MSLRRIRTKPRGRGLVWMRRRLPDNGLGSGPEQGEGEGEGQDQKQHLSICGIYYFWNNEVHEDKALSVYLVCFLFNLSLGKDRDEDL